MCPLPLPRSECRYGGCRGHLLGRPAGWSRLWPASGGEHWFVFPSPQFCVRPPAQAGKRPVPALLQKPPRGPVWAVLSDQTHWRRVSEVRQVHRTRSRRPVQADGLFAWWCLFLLIVTLAFNVCPELSASFRSHPAQIILQFLGVFGEFLPLEIFRCWGLWSEEGKHNGSSC